MGDVTLGEGGVCTIKPSWVPHELVHRVSIVTTKLKTTFPKTFLLAIVLALPPPSSSVNLVAVTTRNISSTGPLARTKRVVTLPERARVTRKNQLCEGKKKEYGGTETDLWAFGFCYYE